MNRTERRKEGGGCRVLVVPVICLVSEALNTSEVSGLCPTHHVWTMGFVNAVVAK